MAAAQYDAALLFYSRPEATSAVVTGVSPRVRGKVAKAQAAEQQAALGQIRRQIGLVQAELYNSKCGLRCVPFP